MRVRFQLWGQLRQALGVAGPEVELDAGGVAADAVQARLRSFQSCGPWF